MEDTTIEDVLKTIQTLHNQKDYEGALRVLKDHRNDLSPGLWHYNMGTLYAEMQNFPQARFHLLMAEGNGYSTKELFQNKEIVETKLDIPRIEKSLTFKDQVIKGSLFASEGILTSLALVCILAGIIALWKKAGMKIFAAFVMMAAFILGVNYWIKSWDKFITLEQVPIHEGPSAIFKTTEGVPPGVMIIAKRKGEWMHITYPGRFSGWIREQGLKEMRE